MKRLFAILLASVVTISSKAQMVESYVQEGEFGIAIGAAHYFGDLNTRAALNRPKFSAGAFFRKQFGNYIGLKIGANYAQLGYSDVYSQNETQKDATLASIQIFGNWLLVVISIFSNFILAFQGSLIRLMFR